MLSRRTLIAGLMASGAATVVSLHASESEVDLALVLAVDCSFSVDYREFQLQMVGLGQAFQDDDVKKAIMHGAQKRIAVSVIEWSDENSQAIALPWTIIDSEAQADRIGEKIKGLRRALAEGGTSISSALLYSEAMLTEAPRAERLVVDVSSDGRNNIGVPVAAVRDRLVARGITINALAILNEWPTLDVYFEKQVAGGPYHFVVPANDYGAYAEAIKAKLLREITGPGIS
jgi:Protein of unknown function (DUF1194)